MTRALSKADDFRGSMERLRHRAKVTTNKTLAADLVRVLDAYDELDNAITWDTSCLNCASLMDANYDAFARLQQIRALTMEPSNGDV